MPVLKLIATEVDSQGRPTAGKKLGARLIFTDDLRETASGPVVGQHSGECVLVREPNWWFCRAGWALATGNLVAGGLLDFSAGPNFTVAIFGGTGAYNNAQGQIKGTSNPQQTDYVLEILP